MRLISFLGTGNYGETTYAFDGKTCRTRFVVHGLANITQPDEIRIIATTEAWDAHGNALAQELSGSKHPVPKQVHVPTGGEPQQLWQMFEAIVEVIRTSQGPVLLDITHGFRMQPFFASACIQYIQSVLAKSPQIRVVYGEYRGPDHESPIWDLTPFLEVLTWSRNLMMFLRTGQADEVVIPTEALGRELSRQWAMAGRQGAQPQLRSLAHSLEAFSNDFTTIRTGSLLTGNPSSAQRLLGAIDQTRAEVAHQLPALSLVLEQVRAMVEPLCTNGERLSSTSGQRALISLARLYQKMGRYSEASSIIREGWITLDAPANTDQPGTDEFDNDWRGVQENVWRLKTKSSLSVSELRNDIQHAGFNKQPHERGWFEQQITSLLQKWESDIDATSSNLSEDFSVASARNISADSKQVEPLPRSPSKNVVFYSLGVDQPITTQEQLPPLPEIQRGALVVIEGRAPIWRYGMAFHLLHGSPAGAIAVYDPRLGAVVIASHHPDWKEGQVIEIKQHSD